MAIWATLDDYLPAQAGAGLVGRSVANYSFLTALLRYSCFDSFHFFLMNKAHIDAFTSAHKEKLEAQGLWEKIELFERLQLPEAIEKYDYTVFHLSDHVSHFSSLCFLRNKYGNFPVSASIHSLSYQRFMRAYVEFALGGVSAADMLLCSSAAGKEVVRKCLDDVAAKTTLEMPNLGLELMPLGLDGQGLPRGQSGAFRQELLEHDEAVIGLYFGRFSDVDKMDLLPLLNAFSQIAANNPKAHLWLAGSVQEKEYFEIVKLWIRRLRLESQVKIFENPSEEIKWELYGAADFFVSLSDNPQETFGITLLEAMAFGLPLLVSDYDGYKNLVHDKIALTVPTMWNKFPILEELSPFLDERTYHRYLGQSLSLDNGCLSKHLQQLYNDADGREILGANARREFMQKYDYRVIIPALEHLWREAKSDFGKEKLSVNDPCAMMFSSVFEHYPTLFLQGRHRIKRTAFAEQWLEGGGKYPLLFSMDSIFSWDDALEVLKTFEEPCLVEEFVDKYAQEKWKSQYVISWLLKHGFLEILGDIDAEL